MAGAYLCEVDLNRALADPRNATRQAALKREIEDNSATRRVTVRVDSRGRLLSVSYDVKLSEANGKNAKPYTLEMTFSKHGEPLNLHLPPESKIRPATKAEYQRATKLS